MTWFLHRQQGAALKAKVSPPQLYTWSPSTLMRYVRPLGSRVDPHRYSCEYHREARREGGASVRFRYRQTRYGLAVPLRSTTADHRDGRDGRSKNTFAL